MKKLALWIMAAAAGLSSCKNFEITHPDFKYTSAYFPYQFPVRTLVLGNSIYDNTNDNNHQFMISLHMGGVYENNKARTFDIAVDNSLSDSLLFNAGGDTVQAMPTKYYTLESEQITIPAGKLYGGVTVQLSDAFFQDKNALKLTYIIPVRITEAPDVDTILNGQTELPGADPRITADWGVPPKNFTMFAVKYVNEFHGTYFHYGKGTTSDQTGNTVEDTTYMEKEMVNNPTTQLITTGRNDVALKFFLNSTVMAGETTLLLHFEQGKCTISAPDDSSYTATGSGTFEEGAYSWGNKQRDGIALNYKITKGNYTFTGTDVLVLRDRGIVMETYAPVKYED